MKRGRLWFPLDVDFWDDPDVVAVGESAAVLFQRLIGYSKRQQTDGVVPMAVVKRLGGRRWAPKLDALVSHGMATLAANAAPDCDRVGGQECRTSDAEVCTIVAFLAWNDSSDDIEQRREIARKKKSRQRRARTNVPGGQPANVPAMSPSQETDTEEEIDLTPDGVSSARERATHAADRSKPDPRDPLSFDGELADAARMAHSAACVAAGGIPRAQGSFAAQSAYRTVAAKAQAVSQEIGEPVPVLLEQSARGFVGTRGSGGRAEWWAENFEGYLERGRGGQSRATMTPVSSRDDHAADAGRSSATWAQEGV